MTIKLSTLVKYEVINNFYGTLIITTKRGRSDEMSTHVSKKATKLDNLENSGRHVEMLGFKTRLGDNILFLGSLRNN